MVSQRIELFLSLLLPLLGGGLVYGILQFLGGTDVSSHELQSLITIISLLVAMAFSVIPRHLIQAELQNGIARLKNGTMQFSEELSVRSLLGGEIESWVPFNQPLHTTLCIVGPNDWRYMDVVIERHITRSPEGKLIAANIDTIYPQLEQQLQQLILASSGDDPSFADYFAEEQLMNDEDIYTFKSKLLSTIESAPIAGIEYGFDPTSIIIGKDSIRWVERKPDSGQEDAHLLSDEDDLEIDHLIKQGELHLRSSHNRTK